MKKENKLSITKLQRAYNRLEEGAANAWEQLHKDGVIKRFEFTFELFWKTLKIHLMDKDEITNSPREALKAAFRRGWLGIDEQIFLDMLDDRNISTHIYSEQESDQIFQRIKDVYIAVIGEVIERLKKVKEDKNS